MTREERASSRYLAAGDLFRAMTWTAHTHPWFEPLRLKALRALHRRRLFWRCRFADASAPFPMTVSWP